MKFLRLVSISSLVLLAGALPASAAPVKALVGGRLIDGYGGPPIENSVVVIEGEKIGASPNRVET